MSAFSGFLGLTPAEETLCEVKAHLTALLKALRHEKGLTQAQVADMMETSQQAIARAEAANPSVSLEFVLRALLTMGLSLPDVCEELCAIHKLLHPEP